MRSDNNRQHFVDTTELSMYRFEPQYLLLLWAPSTRIRINLKTRKRFSGYGFRPQVSSVFARWKRFQGERNLKTLFCCSCVYGKIGTFWKRWRHFLRFSPSAHAQWRISRFWFRFRVYAWTPKTIQKWLRVDAEFFEKEIDIFAFANLSGYVSTHCTGP